MYQINTDVIEKAPSVTAIATREEQAVAIELLARLKDAVKQIEKQRVDLKKPHLDAGAAVDAEAKSFKQRFEVHIERIEPLLIAYDQRQRALAEEQRKAAEEKARAEAAELKRLADEQAAEASKKAAEAAELAELALEVGTEEEQLEALAQSEAADKARMGAQIQAGNIEAVTAMLVGAAVRNVYTGRATGVSGATAKSAIEYVHELENIALVPEQYLVAPEDRIKRSALPRPSQTRPAEIPGFRIVERTALRTRI